MCSMGDIRHFFTWCSISTQMHELCAIIKSIIIFDILHLMLCLTMAAKGKQHSALNIALSLLTAQMFVEEYGTFLLIFKDLFSPITKILCIYIYI